MSRDGIVTTRNRTTMAGKEPYSSNVSTMARPGQVNAATELKYRGYEDVLPGLLGLGVDTAETLIKLDKKEKKLEEEQLQKMSDEYWANAAFVRDSSWQNLTQEERDRVEKEAAAKGQLPGDYYAKSIELKMQNQLNAQGTIPMHMSATSRDKFYYSERFRDSFATEDARVQRAIVAEEQMNNKIIDTMVESGLAVTGPNGEVDRDATRQLAIETAEATQRLQSANDRTLYEAAGFTPEQYQTASDTQKVQMNSRLTQVTNRLMLDAAVKPLITKMRNTNSADFEKMNSIKREYLTILTEASNKVGMLNLPPDVVTEFRKQVTDYRALIGDSNLKDVDAANTLKAQVEYAGLQLQANALADSGVYGQLARISLALGSQPAAALMQSIDNLFGGFDMSKVPANIKNPVRINAAEGQATGSLPYTGNPQIDSNAYKLSQQTLYAPGTQGPTKEASVNTKIKENALKIADEKFSLVATGRGGYSNKERMDAQREAIEMFTNKNSLENIDTIGRDNATRKNLLDSSYSLMYDYAHTNTKSFLSGNNSTLDLINYDVNKGMFVAGSDSDKTEKAQSIFAKPLKAIGNWVSSSKRDEAVDTLNLTLKAMGNNRARVITHNITAEDLNEIAIQLTEDLNASYPGEIKIVGTNKEDQQ